MDPDLDEKDPLRHLPPLSRYPFELPELYEVPKMGDMQRARDALKAYNQLGQDRTRDILAAFLDHLPKGGKHTLESEIAAFADQNDKLRQLADFLRDAILKPSM